jgi:hypothetical protein
MYKSENQLIICGDINKNYLNESKEKDELNDLLTSFNVNSIITFPSRITKNTMSIIDNIFIDITIVSNFMTSPIINGLLEHDAQTLEIYTKNFDRKKDSIKTKSIRQFNKFTIN